ncbi:asparagine synthase (glutamine-hydrolyzing) [Maribacter aurantiacus]|uniref:asparagine synthase (glutamine-hydrolyzing) n=1 Tax=Maribacter aurantiacus TaxID=1882343 RepID=A0A5R8M707_9FLAO|nr:asparagine synthase (glutamine-hydrolyzing) [Maribacter aurantiacus]TLF44549.1 asparagine synthase (glutamine-hydrolyzing) [Maribacter aurantiacus]
MCGIYGTTLPYTKEQIQQKLQRTQFRGPDQMGVQSFDSQNGGIHFGHNRLSIIDLDARSNQPFSYEEQVHLVFNGEIYNFKEIRAILSNKGYAFRTTSDTEVIAAAYLEYGQDCVRLFNGMFAFVIYDVKKQLLFGAKDRLGQKPFYYQLSPQGFEFASQISSIQLFNEQLSISQEAIEQYLGWNSVPLPNSIFNEVKKLEDGHAFTYTLGSKSFKSWAYWDIAYPTAPQYSGTYEQATKDLENLLTDAVLHRMIADVPLGVFLSGGVDSSLIAALASKGADKRVKTFSVKFNEDGFDESQYAQKVANHLGTDHHVIECDYREGLSLIENFSYYYDEPFADASAIPSMLLAKHTKKEVTVALSGDGADEAFLGYHRYSRIDKMKSYFKIPYIFRKPISELLKLSPNSRHKAIGEVFSSKNENFVYLTSLFRPNEIWLEEQKDPYNFKELRYLMHNKKDIYERAGDLDLKTYLSWDINTKVDRATMAYSLEARSPFLDYRVVEMAQSLPTEFKYQPGKQKRILKDILYKHVPQAYFDRPKSGFGMPLEVWFRKDLKDLVLTELSIQNLNEIPGIRPKVVSKLIQEHMECKWNHYTVIWKLLVLRQWLTNNGKSISIS